MEALQFAFFFSVLMMLVCLELFVWVSAHGSP